MGLTGDLGVVTGSWEDRMKKWLYTTLAFAMLGSTVALAGEPIEGTWLRDNGTLIKYASAGGDKYCGTVQNNKYKGQSIGCMSGSGGKYKGEVIVLDEGKTYSGKASVSGNTLSLAGCVLGGLICKSADLKRQ
jgi:uncharacterized protein (DUF2147 family)